MKKYTSVLMLINRGLVIRLTLTALLTAVVQAALFFMAAGSGGALEATLDQSRIYIPAAAGFLLSSLFICLNCASGCALTLDRLSVSPGRILALHTLMNTLWYVIFWASQVLATLLLCRIFTAEAEAGLVGRQTVFLAFYRDSYLHGLMPLADSFLLARNLILIPALGFTTACFSHDLRHGRRSISAAVMVLGGGASFCAEITEAGGRLVICIILALFCAAACLWRYFTEGQNEPDMP